jgi:hypothetical protein
VSIGGLEVVERLGSDAWAERMLVRTPEGQQLALWWRRASHDDDDARGIDEAPPLRACFVRTYARGTHLGRAFVALAEADATPLADALRARVSTGVARDAPQEDRCWHAAALFADVADALAELSGSGSTIDDLVPSAIVVDATGRARLLPSLVTRPHRGRPMSIAQAAERAAAEGSLRYLAPERFRGEPATEASQLYALGAMIFELFAGRPPCDGATPVDVALAHLAEPPPSLDALAPDVPSILADLAMRLLAKDPRDRPESARVVAALLRGEPPPTISAHDGRLALPSLVGREEQLRVLQDAMADAAASRPRFVLITAGIGEGKTRLLDEAVRWAQLRGHLVGIATGGAGVLGALIASLRAAIEETFGRDGVAVAFSGAATPLLERDGEDAEDVSPAQRIEALRALVGQAQGLAPLLIAIDDAHRLDEATTRALWALATAPECTRVCTLLTFGEETLPAHVAQLVGRLAARKEARRAELSPLTPLQVEAAVASMLGAARVPESLLVWLDGRAAGSPYLVRELVQAATDRGALRRRAEGWSFEASEVATLPEGAMAMLAARLANLTVEQRALAVDVALLGEMASQKILERCTELEPQLFAHSLDALLRARVIEQRRGGKDSYWLTHAALRERLLADVAPEQVAQAHRRIAVAVENATAGRPSLPALRIIAYHREQAGDRAEAADRWLRFCQRAVRRGDADLAREGIEGVGRCAERAELESDRVRWLRSDVHRLAGELREAERLLRAMAQQGSAARRAEAFVRLAKVFEDEGRMRDALEAAEASLDAIGARPLPRGLSGLVVMVFGYLGLLLWPRPRKLVRRERDLELSALVMATRVGYVTDRRLGTTAYFRARSRARRVGDRDHWIWVECALAVTLALALAHRRAQRVTREGVASYRTVEDPALRLQCASSLMVASGLLGAEIDQQVFLRDTESLANAVGDRFTATLARGYRAYALWQRGRLDEAHAAIEAQLGAHDGRGKPGKDDAPRTEARLLRASLADEVSGGASADARARRSSAPPVDEDGVLEIPHLGLHENVLGSIAAARGDEEELTRLRNRAASLASGAALYAPHDELLVCSSAAKMALATGDTGTAVLWARRTVEAMRGSRSATALTIEAWGVYLIARALDGVRTVDELDRIALAEAYRAFRGLGAARAVVARGIALWAWSTESKAEAARVLEEEARHRPEGWAIYDCAINDLCAARILAATDPRVAADRSARGKRALRRIGAVAPAWLAQIDLRRSGSHPADGRSVPSPVPVSSSAPPASDPRLPGASPRASHHEEGG